MVEILCKLNFNIFVKKLLSFFFLTTFLPLQSIPSNDVELNPGPEKDSSKRNLSVARWNLDSVAAQNFVKLSQLEIYNTMYSYDIICLSETWLDYNFHRLQ